MQVSFNGELSDILTLIGGGPQGTLLGQIMYLVQTNSNADCVEQEDRFKYIDDLFILKIVCLAGLVREYNFQEHVASDVGIDQVFLPPKFSRTDMSLLSDAMSASLAKVLQIAAIHGGQGPVFVPA